MHCLIELEGTVSLLLGLCDSFTILYNELPDCKVKIHLTFVLFFKVDENVLKEVQETFLAIDCLH